MRVLFLLLLILSACAEVPGRPPSLQELSPRLLLVYPPEGEQLSLDPEFRLFFSDSIDLRSVDDDSILLVEGAGERDEIEEMPRLPLQYSAGADPREIRVAPEAPLQPDSDYSLVVTRKVRSEKGLPLSLTIPSNSGWVTVYRTAGLMETIEPDPFPDEALQPLPDSPVPAETEGERSGEPLPLEPAPGEPAGAEEPSFVVINEILYDLPGTDTDGLLFVELFGSPGKQLDRYQILFINGENGQKTDGVTLPDGSRIGSDGYYLIADSRDGQATVTQVPSAELIDNFDPQNGPDAVQLLDAGGNLIDLLGYGEGVVAEGSPAIDAAGGHSLERVLPGQDTGNNAADFVEKDAPTPGR